MRVLVTGFGPFPGAKANPTSTLVHALEKERPRLAQLGIRLELAILPAVYAEVPLRLEALTQAYRPEAILHFGLAARRRLVCIETRAMNRLSLLRPDASGATSRQVRIRRGAPQFERSTFPAVEIAAALHRAGIACRLSNNAGKFICNQTLYLSLAQGTARQIGFIHVPRLASRHRRPDGMVGHRPSLVELTRAAIIAIRVTAGKLRCDRVTPTCNNSTETPGPASLDPIASVA